MLKKIFIGGGVGGLGFLLWLFFNKKDEEVENNEVHVDEEDTEEVNSVELTPYDKEFFRRAGLKGAEAKRARREALKNES